MNKAYNEGKDLYAMIAQSAFHNNYEDNLEFWPEGTELEIDGKKVIAGKKTHLNKDGKARRSTGKVLNLAATYGMSGSTAGQRLGYTGKEAKEKGEELLNNFFTGFSGVKKAIDDSKVFLQKNGYVEDFLGRRRRLTDINLPKYEVMLKGIAGGNENFNPFFGCMDRVIADPRIVKWETKVQEKINSSQKYQAKEAEKHGRTWEPNGEMGNQSYEELAKEALKDGIIIRANTGRIAQASRQCFNARIQGSAASLTKLAMVDIFNDPQLKAWNAHLIITVHDEVLVECPEEYAEQVEKRLPEIMIAAAKKGGDTVPQACDPYNVTRWYSDTAAASLLDELKKMEKNGLTKEEATEQIYINHIELPKAAIIKTLETGCDLDF